MKNQFSTMTNLTPRGQLIIGGVSINCERLAQEPIDAGKAFSDLAQAITVVSEKFDTGPEVRDALIQAGAFIRGTIKAKAANDGPVKEAETDG